jgi:hypothetical protein
MTSLAHTALALAMLTAGAWRPRRPSPRRPRGQAPAAAPQAPGPVSYARADVMALAEKVADYQLATMAAGYIPPNTSRRHR